MWLDGCWHELGSPPALSVRFLIAPLLTACFMGGAHLFTRGNLQKSLLLPTPT